MDSKTADIKIYITPTCKWSPKLREWLKKRRIAFQEFDVFESDNERYEMIEKSGQMATPVMTCNGTVMVGFHEEKLQELFKK